MSPETVFDTAGTHESHYSNPEHEWETEAYSNPYSQESEWETEAYSNPFSPESEWENEQHYTNPFAQETEWENESPYVHEASMENIYSNPYVQEREWEDEGEYFSLGGLWKGIKKVGRTLAPIAKKFAPSIAGSLVSLIPGVGPALAPFANKATKMLLKEGEAEAAQLESQLFVAHEGEMEVANTELAQQIALTEFLAAQAAEAESESEAEAAIAASLPVTITIMGGRRALRPVIPILSQANARVVSALRRRGPAGSELLRLMPTIHRQTVGTLRAASRAGQPITAPAALKTMAHVTRKVLNSPHTVARAVDRNILLKQRVAPSAPRRSGISGYGRSTAPQSFRRPASAPGRHSKTMASSLRYV